MICPQIADSVLAKAGYHTYKIIRIVRSLEYLLVEVLPNWAAQSKKHTKFASPAMVRNIPGFTGITYKILRDFYGMSLGNHVFNQWRR